MPAETAWGKEEWAQWWLALGGFDTAMDVDTDGWTPIMYAVQALGVGQNKPLSCMVSYGTVMYSARVALSNVNLAFACDFLRTALRCEVGVCWIDAVLVIKGLAEHMTEEAASSSPRARILYCIVMYCIVL